MQPPELKLTAEERQWCDVYDTATRKGVKLRRYSDLVALTATVRRVSVTLNRIVRRGRVYGITWAGNVTALKVYISRSDGEQLTTAPTHIPLLSGHSPHSTLSRLPLEGAYPTPAVISALQTPPAWEYRIEPNLIVPAGTQLQFEYSLEDPADAVLAAGGTLRVQQVVHVWEFPGWGGYGS